MVLVKVDEGTIQYRCCNFIGLVHVAPATILCISLMAEMDDNTGLYYYGAGGIMTRESALWHGVDPLTWLSWLSSYTYYSK